MVKVEIHDMTVQPNRVEIVELEAVPRIGETFHWSDDDGGIWIKAVLHVPGKPPQVRGW